MSVNSQRVPAAAAVPRGARAEVRTLLLMLCMAALTIGCASYGDRVAPVPLPESRADHVEVDGAKIVATPYVQREAAKAALGFDARGAGLLPVRFVVDNQGDDYLEVRPEQTFLIDREGQAWPLLSSEQAYRRVQGHTELAETAKGAGKPSVLMGAAGALAGLAVGVLTGDDLASSAGKGAVVGGASGAIVGGATGREEVKDRIRRDLARESLRNQRIGPGELAYGYLFFPGKDEARSARELRLGLEIGDRKRVISFSLGGKTGS